MELAQIDMIYSLLSMLNTDDKEHISRTLLGMSTCRDSCIAMRQAGCMSLLVQLIHGCPDSSRNTSGTGSRVARQRAAAALHNLVHCLPDEKWRRREARVLRLLEIVREYSDNQQQRMAASPQLASVHVDSSRVESTIAALMKLSFDEDHRHAITVLGGLQAVSELLVVDLEMFPIGSRSVALSLNIRRFGCMTLTNLTFGDVTNKALLCSMPTTLKAVVALLGFLENEDIVQAAGSVLRNLSWSADLPSKNALRDAGAVKQLVRSVMGVKRESTRIAVFSALWNVSAHLSENKADICATEGALDFISYALTLPGSIGESAGGVLRNISSHIAVNPDYRLILRRRGCLEVLVEQLKSTNLTTVSNACGALWNLSAKCPEDQQLLWDLNAVSSLQALINSKHQMIATAASAAIRNLQSYKSQVTLDHSQQQQQQNFVKPVTSKAVSEGGDVSTLSSSFPGPGRQHSHPTALSSPSPGYPNISSPFASSTGGKGVSTSAAKQAPHPQNAAAVLGLLTGNSNSGVATDAKAGQQGKTSILYSDTPNSNVVHLNYLHMLATRGSGQQQQPPPPPPVFPPSLQEFKVPPGSQSLSARLPTSSSIGAPTAMPTSTPPPQTVQQRSVCASASLHPDSSSATFGKEVVGHDNENDNDDEDEQPTNFGQRFQEEEVLQDQVPQKSSFIPGNNNLTAATKSNISPSDSSGSSSRTNNENKISQQQQQPPQSTQKPVGKFVIKQQQQQHVSFAAAVETVEQTPMMFSRRSSVDSLNSVDVPSIRSEVASEYSRVASGAVSPTDLPESPGAIAEDEERLRRQQTAFRVPTTTAFATPPQPLKSLKQQPINFAAAPLAAAEESFPAVDSYADEAERPVVYATEDTPAMLSHATSLSNLTTPGFETPGGAFSPVRAVAGDRPVSPPTAATMRLQFPKPVEPEPVEDEVLQYYTEDTPCHLSASSSLSSLSVMSRASSSHRSATGTPLRQKVFSMQQQQSTAMGSNNVPAFGQTQPVLHPRVVAAAARHDPYLRQSPFISALSVPMNSGNSPFVVSSPLVASINREKRRENAVLLEESEDSHNLSGFGEEEEEEKQNDKEKMSDNEIVEKITVVEPSQDNKDVDDVDGDDVSDTEDLIQQLIDTALESPKSDQNGAAGEEEVVVESNGDNVLVDENDVEKQATVVKNEGDLDLEPTAKELELLEECINLVLTSDNDGPVSPTSKTAATRQVSKSPVAPTAVSEDSGNDLRIAAAAAVAPAKSRPAKMQLRNVSSSKGRSPNKTSSGPQSQKVVSSRVKCTSSKLGSADSSPMDAGRPGSPGSVSRGGSSGSSGVAQLSAKKQSSSTTNKRSPTGAAAQAAKRAPQTKQRRSRSGSEQVSPSSVNVATSKVSPSFSSTASLNVQQQQQQKQASTGNNNSKRWNFSTRPSPPQTTSSETASSEKTCCRHYHPNERATEQRPAATVWQRPQVKSPGKKTTKTSPVKDNQAAHTDGTATTATTTTTTSGGKSSRRVLMTTV